LGKNLAKREKTLLVTCIVLAGLAVLYSMVIEPLTASWKMLNSKIDGKITELAKNARLLKMYGAIEAEHKRYSEFIKIGKNEEEELARALALVEKLAQDAGSRIANVKPRATRKRGNYREISFVVTTEGAIEKLAKFLHSIEASKELLSVKHFTLTPRSGSKGNLKATFLISKIIVG
jgi:Tfp pilus assembly protein PilO